MLHKQLEQIYKLHPPQSQPSIHVMGDFNFRKIDWETHFPLWSAGTIRGPQTDWYRTRPLSRLYGNCSDERLTLETSDKHHIPQATNIPYQPLLIKPIFSVLANVEKQFFSKLVFQHYLDQGLKLNDIARDHYLEQLITLPTREDKTLDLIFDQHARPG